MIELRVPYIWIQLPNGNYYRLGAGLTELKETGHAVLLEKESVNSPICGREILRQKGQLEFKGYQVPEDTANHWICNCFLKAGERCKTAVVRCDPTKKLSSGDLEAKRISGSVLVTERGAGDGIYGATLKGMILYDGKEAEGVFDETTETFTAF